MEWLAHSPVLPAAVAVSALILLVLGRRGRRVNDHPICRRCGFDLIGRPAGSTTCSECGADLRGRRAVRVGARRRVGRVMAVAVLLLVPSLAVLVFHGWSAFSDSPLVQRKPVWWLLNDASSRDPVVRDDAFNELTRRLRDGRHSRAQVGQVVGRALEIQGDARRTWLTQWGDFVDEARRAEKVSAKQWERFVRQAPQFDVVVTERFKRGDRAWLELVERPSRVGSKQDFVVRVHRRLTITDRNGASVRRHFGAVTYYVGSSSRLQGGWSLPLNDGIIGRLADGRHEGRMELVVEVLAARAGSNRPIEPPIARTQLELRTTWVVEPATAGESGVAVKPGGGEGQLIR